MHVVCLYCSYIARRLRKGGLSTYANSEDPDQPAHPRIRAVWSGASLLAYTIYRDLVEDTGLITKILTRYMAAQWFGALLFVHALRGFFCQPAAHLCPENAFLMTQHKCHVKPYFHVKI